MVPGIQDWPARRATIYTIGGSTFYRILLHVYGLEMCGNNILNFIPSHSHDFFPIPIRFHSQIRRSSHSHFPDGLFPHPFPLATKTVSTIVVHFRSLRRSEYILTFILSFASVKIMRLEKVIKMYAKRKLIYDFFTPLLDLRLHRVFAHA